MVRPLICCLLVLGVVELGQCQVGLFGGLPCPTNAAHFLSGRDACCQSFVNLLFGICCVDNMGGCRCNKIATQCTVGSQYCPDMSRPRGRLLNSVPVPEEVCQARGVIGISVMGHQFCNGAFARDPSGKDVIHLPTDCWNIRQSLGALGLSTNVQLNGTIAGVNFTLDSFSVTEEQVNGGATALVLHPQTAYYIGNRLAECGNPGCVYNPRSMQDALTQDCFISSYGRRNITFLPTIGEANRVKVTVADVTRCPNPPAGSQCFVPTTQGGGCFGDNGAPVYCQLTTNETVLYGLASVPFACNPDEPGYFSVIPIKNLN